MECDEFNDPPDDHGEVPSGLLCSEASSVSDKVVNILGDALEEHRLAVTHKLGLSSDGPLSEALHEWCQLPGSTVFVLRAVLVDIGRKDLAEKLVHEIMLTMSLYLVVEDVDLNTSNARRQFYTVTTHCDVTLATALESFLPGNLNRYRIIGPEDWVSWSTPARELKGRQLTLRYIASKTDKAVYGCNSDTGDALDVKGQAYKANFHEPAKGLSELKGLHTMGVENRPIHDENATHLKRAQTMPIFNIPPGDQLSDEIHAIQDLKQPAISPALSSESVTNNLAAMNTMTTPSPSVSLSLVGQGGSSCQGMSLTLTTIEDQLTIDSTHVKVPMGKKATRRFSIPDGSGDSVDVNNDYVSTTELKTRKETNTSQLLTVAAGGADQESTVHRSDNSVFQQSLSNNNLQTSHKMMEQNQLSGPVVYKQQQKDNNYLETNVNQQPSTTPFMNAHKKDNSYLNTYVKSVPTFENEEVGFKELNESMEYSQDDDGISDRNQCALNNDVNLSSSLDLARIYNRDPDSDSTSNIYTPFSAMISPLSGHDGSHEEGTDTWNEDSSVNESVPESDANNVDENLVCKSTQEACPVPFLNVSNGKYLALQEQDRKLRQVTSDPQCPSAIHHRLLGADQAGADFKTNFPHSKPSPFVHTPPPPLYSSDTYPPSYLDVTSMPGREFFHWGIPPDNNICPPGHYHPQCNCHVLQSHSQTIAHTTCPQHHLAPIVPLPVPARSLPAHPVGFGSYGRGRDVGVQTPPARRHFSPNHPFSDTISSVSEPTIRHSQTGRQLPHISSERLGCQNSLYLTPLHDFGERHGQNNIMTHGIPSQMPRVAMHPRPPTVQGNDVDGDYSYIEDPRLLRQNIRRQSNLEVPNRAPPPPPRPQMNLEDQLAKINGWCPGATDATIERIMKDYRGQNGYYIVWRSQAKNRFVISVSHKRELLHFLIEQTMMEHSSYRYLYYIYKGGFSSESLLELVNHYISCGVKQRLNDSPIGTKAYLCEHIPLRRPLKMRKSFSVDS